MKALLITLAIVFIWGIIVSDIVTGKPIANAAADTDPEAQPFIGWSFVPGVPAVPDFMEALKILAEQIARNVTSPEGKKFIKIF
ncbi:hypothetical protein P5V15_001721 [Pogonomyrmex californicus]